MIRSKILQGHYTDVHTELVTLLCEIENRDEISNVKFELATSSSGIGIVTTILVIWEELEAD